MKNPLTHDKALQAAYQEYGRFIQAGEGSLKAIERAVEIYNYVTKEQEKMTMATPTPYEIEIGDLRRKIIVLETLVIAQKQRIDNAIITLQDTGAKDDKQGLIYSLILS